jgi:hypothetical protein
VQKVVEASAAAAAAAAAAKAATQGPAAAAAGAPAGDTTGSSGSGSGRGSITSPLDDAVRLLAGVRWAGLDQLEAASGRAKKLGVYR